MFWGSLKVWSRFNIKPRERSSSHESSTQLRAYVARRNPSYMCVLYSDTTHNILSFAASLDCGTFVIYVKFPPLEPCLSPQHAAVGNSLWWCFAFITHLQRAPPLRTTTSAALLSQLPHSLKWIMHWDLAATMLRAPRPNPCLNSGKVVIVKFI